MNTERNDIGNKRKWLQIIRTGSPCHPCVSSLSILSNPPEANLPVQSHNAILVFRMIRNADIMFPGKVGKCVIAFEFFDTVFILEILEQIFLRTSAKICFLFDLIQIRIEITFFVPFDRDSLFLMIVFSDRMSINSILSS